MQKRKNQLTKKERYFSKRKFEGLNMQIWKEAIQKLRKEIGI